MTDDMSSENGSVSTVRNKIVFVGDVFVGKTSVMCRFIENIPSYVRGASIIFIIYDVSSKRKLLYRKRNIL
jgi:GTPase SAR1 family protein